MASAEFGGTKSVQAKEGIATSIVATSTNRTNILELFILFGWLQYCDLSLSGSDVDLSALLWTRSGLIMIQMAQPSA